MRVPTLLISILFSSLSWANNSIDFIEVNSESDWENAIERAKSENKLLFVDAYADWCGYCHQLDNEVYTNPQVIDYFNKNFINVKFDTETEYGMLLADHYEITSLPTLFFITGEREVFETIEGFVPAPTLLAHGEQTLTDYADLPLLEQKYNELIITKDEQLDLIRILEKKDREKAAEIAKSYFSLLTASDYINNVENIWLASRFENQLGSVPYTYIQQNREEIVAAHGLEEYQDYFKAIFNDNLELAIKYGDENVLYELVRKVLPEFLPEVEIPEASFITKKIYFGQRQEYKQYQFEIRSFLNNNVKAGDRVNFLFSNALEIIQEHADQGMYQFAADLLTQAVAINQEHFESTALLGYAHALLGDFDVADEKLSQAKELAKTDEQREMADDLISAIKAMRG